MNYSGWERVCEDIFEISQVKGIRDPSRSYSWWFVKVLKPSNKCLEKNCHCKYEDSLLTSWLRKQVILKDIWPNRWSQISVGIWVSLLVFQFLVTDGTGSQSSVPGKGEQKTKFNGNFGIRKPLFNYYPFLVQINKIVTNPLPFYPYNHTPLIKQLHQGHLIAASVSILHSPGIHCAPPTHHLSYPTPCLLQVNTWAVLCTLPGSPYSSRRNSPRRHWTYR